MNTYVNDRISSKIDVLEDNDRLFQGLYMYDIEVDSINRILAHLMKQFDSMAYALNYTSLYDSRRNLDSFTEF